MTTAIVSATRRLRNLYSVLPNGASQAASFVIAALLLIGTPAPSGAKDHIIGYTTISFARAPFWIANDLNLYEKNGVDAEVVFLRGGTVGTQALISGSASFLASSGSAAVDAILSGADLVIIAGYSNLLDQILVTRKEIGTAAQIKGARVALNSLNGGSILAARITLNALGLNADKDVSYVALGDPASRFNALKAGLVDATVLTTPFNTVAKKAGYKVYDDIPALQKIDYPADSIIATREFVTKQPAVAAGVIKAVVEAIRVFKTNKAQSLGIVSKYLRGLSQEDLEDAYARYVGGFRENPEPSVKSIQTVLQWSKHPGAKTADPSRFIYKGSTR